MFDFVYFFYFYSFLIIKSGVGKSSLINAAFKVDLAVRLSSFHKIATYFSMLIFVDNRMSQS